MEVMAHALMTSRKELRVQSPDPFSRPGMSTLSNRLGMHVSRTPDPHDTAALFLILELDWWDIQQGNFSDSDEFFEELDREESNGDQ